MHEALIGGGVALFLASVAAAWKLAVYVNTKNGNLNSTYVRRDLCDERHKGTEKELKNINRKLGPIPKIEAYIELQAKQKGYKLPQNNEEGK